MSIPNFPSRQPMAGQLVALVLEIVFLWGAQLRPPREAPSLFIGLALAAFVVYLLAAQRALSSSPLDRVGNAAGQSFFVLVGALLLRGVALAGTYDLSDDLFRYLWEGKVGLAGFNPLVLPPLDPVLLPLRDAIQARVNHPELPSVYPPLAQLLFRGLAWLWYDPRGPRVLFLLFDLLTVGALLVLLQQRGQSGAPAILYAWNPLPVLEFAGNGHLDSAAIAFLLWGVVCLESSRVRPAVGALLLAASTLTKLLAIALVPLVLYRFIQRREWRSALLFGSVLGGVLVAGSLPTLLEPASQLTGVRAYAGRWEFNASTFALLSWALQPERARALSVAGFGALSLLVAGRQLPPSQGAFYLCGAFFLLSPTAHPWYLCWVLPFAALSGSRPWILLSGTVLLAYSVFMGAGGWEEHPVTPWLVYVPPLLLALVLRRRGGASAPVRQ